MYKKEGNLAGSTSTKFSTDSHILRLKSFTRIH